MKHRTPLIFLILYMSLFSVSWADSPGWRHREREVSRYETHRGGDYGHGNGGYRHRHGGWGWSPLAAAAILGSTVYWANTYAQPSVSTVIISPSVGFSPPRTAYFCQTSQQYYPVVPVCEVPWQIVNY